MDGQPSLVAQACRLSSLFLAGGLIALALAAPVLVPIALSPAFSPVVVLVWMLAIGVWARGVTLPISSYFVGRDRPGLVSFLTMLELALSVLCMVPGYRLAGTEGAALGGSVAYLAVGIVRVWLFRRVSNGIAPAIWFPVAADRRYLLDAVDRVLGLKPGPRLVVEGTSDAEPSDRVHRLTALTADRVFKRQSPDRVALELIKTRCGAEIGAATNLFRVPSLVCAATTKTVIAFERIAAAESLWSFLRRQDGSRVAEALVRKAADALVVVHRDLHLPQSESRDMPGEWWLTGHDTGAALHGDYTAFNLLVTDEGRTLWLTDWATSDVFGAEWTIGPRELDVTWFVASLFFDSHLGVRRIARRQRLAAFFIDQYCHRSGIDPRRVARFVTLIAERFTRQRPGLLVRLRRLRHELLSETTLLHFARRFEAGVAEEGGR